jgi:hypothetical protein
VLGAQEEKHEYREKEERRKDRVAADMLSGCIAILYHTYIMRSISKFSPVAATVIDRQSEKGAAGATAAITACP